MRQTVPVPREWDAAAYGGLDLPHAQWGRRTLARLPLRGDERVLDAGCGTGRDTVLLLDRLPHGAVVAVDASHRMLERLRERLGDRAGQVEVVHADLTEPLPIDWVDAVFSVAAFHWITDHDRLFANLAAVMRPGAPLVSDCGGRGNVRQVVRAVEQVLGQAQDDWEFADVDDTRARLARNGFVDIDVRLRESPFRLDDEDADTYLRAVVLGGYLDALPDGEHDDFVAEVLDAMPAPVIDYVRLEITASRAP